MRFTGLNVSVFPLSYLRASLNGYYMSATGDIYSTKQSRRGGLPRKMVGSGESHPTLRSYTLSGFSENGARLFNQAKRHPKWAEETSQTQPMNIPPMSEVDEVGIIQPRQLQGAPANRVHAKSVTEGLRDRGIILATVSKVDGQEVLVFGTKPVIHLTASSYRAEMERLALAKPGVKFVALQVIATVTGGGLKWE